jgi:predicted nucleotidyltransferase
MKLEELRHSNKEQILRLAASYGARNIRIFGSVARGDSSPSSDIDFLVDLDPDRTLMDLGGLLTGLQEILDAPVDVATERMLRPGVRDRVLREAVPLWETPQSDSRIS